MRRGIISFLDFLFLKVDDSLINYARYAPPQEKRKQSGDEARID